MALLFKLANLYRGKRTSSTRTLPQGGLMIAVLGADGAGKTTVVRDLAKWLSREVSVITTYGGSGAGSAGWPRRVMQRLAAWRRMLRPDPGTPEGVPSPAARRLTAARALWVLALARERRKRAREARRARSQGRIVLSDRLAQSQFPGMNDGFRLADWIESRSRWRRWAAERELVALRLTELAPPDLVIKLHVPAEVAMRRKPETPPDQVARGIQLVEGLRWPPATRVVDLDATAPLEETILRARSAVWDAI